MSDLKNRPLNDEALDAVSGGERPDGGAWARINSQIQGAENLAYGIGGQQSVDTWMNSPAHRDNIDPPEFEGLAVALYRTDDGTLYSPSEHGC